VEKDISSFPYPVPLFQQRFRHPIFFPASSIPLRYPYFALHHLPDRSSRCSPFSLFFPELFSSVFSFKSENVSPRLFFHTRSRCHPRGAVTPFFPLICSGNPFTEPPGGHICCVSPPDASFPRFRPVPSFESSFFFGSPFRTRHFTPSGLGASQFRVPPRSSSLPPPGKHFFFF